MEALEKMSSGGKGEVEEEIEEMESSVCENDGYCSYVTKSSLFTDIYLTQARFLG